MKSPILLYPLILILFSCSGQLSNEIVNEGDPIFEKLAPSASGITFQNNLAENDTLNYFTYGYMYMGGGVAVGDLNNDGLADLYFTGNMVGNKLYLNNGGLTFTDITEVAAVAADDRWMTGVTMADVNSDGRLDIYISVAGQSGNKKNILYINKGSNDSGIPTFEDKAEEYGLADTGQSTQGTFFDYDLDGDLDLYVANYPISDFKSPNFYYSNQMKHITSKDSDHLYKNNGDNTFTDITEDAGLLSFGLSLSATVGDFDQDGFPDLYISNDFASPDFMYFNNGDGTFTEKSQKLMRHTSFYGMGVDVADFNNDGLLDIAQMDMTPEDNRRSKANMASMNPEGFKELVNLGLGYQYMKNSLQLNKGLNADGDPIFSDISYLSGVANTDWSWACLFADLDNDGLKDLFVTNGSRRDINNKDYFNKINDDSDKPFSERGKKRENLLELVEDMPSERIDNYVFRNNGDLTFSTVNQEWGLSFNGFSNGAAYADLDNDGDLEVILNNIDDNALIFENLSRQKKNNNYMKFALKGPETNPFGLGTKITIEHDGKKQFQELTLTRGFQSSVEPRVHFGLGESIAIDKVVVKWSDGKEQTLSSVEANLLVELEYTKAETVINEEELPVIRMFTDMTKASNIDFEHKENDYHDYGKEILLPHETSRLGPALAVADVNNDGLEDFYIGNASGSSGCLYVQSTDGSFQASNQTMWETDKEMEDNAAAFFDANGDGFKDLYIVSGGNEFSGEDPRLQDRLYLNNGKGVFAKTKDVLPIMLTSGGCVSPADYDGDGDVDLFVGGRLVPGSYPSPARSYLLENTKDERGNIKFQDVTADKASSLVRPGLVTSAEWVDINKDGSPDLILAGEWMPVMYFQNSGTKLIDKTESAGLSDTQGWWFSLQSGDYDNDGDMDFIAGNLGLNYKYQADREVTFDVFLNDFDNNGQKDIVLSYYNQGKQFPVRGRQCSSEQIPAIKKKFTDYNQFAVATVADVYTESALSDALHYKAKTFASSYIENNGDGTFTITNLPNEAQQSSVHGIVSKDFNNDGNLDVFLAGNFYISEIETPRNDAGIGLLMYGSGQGKFQPVSASASGIYAPYDTRIIRPIQTSQGHGVLLGNNNEPLQLYVNKKITESL